MVAPPNNQNLPNVPQVSNPPTAVNTQEKLIRVKENCYKELCKNIRKKDVSFTSIKPKFTSSDHTNHYLSDAYSSDGKEYFSFKVTWEIEMADKKKNFTMEQTIYTSIEVPSNPEENSISKEKFKKIKDEAAVKALLTAKMRVKAINGAIHHDKAKWENYGNPELNTQEAKVNEAFWKTMQSNSSTTQVAFKFDSDKQLLGISNASGGSKKEESNEISFKAFDIPPYSHLYAEMKRTNQTATNCFESFNSLYEEVQSSTIELSQPLTSNTQSNSNKQKKVNIHRPQQDSQLINEASNQKKLDKIQEMQEAIKDTINEIKSEYKIEEHKAKFFESLFDGWSEHFEFKKELNDGDKQELRNKWEFVHYLDQEITKLKKEINSTTQTQTNDRPENYKHQIQLLDKAIEKYQVASEDEVKKIEKFNDYFNSTDLKETEDLLDNAEYLLDNAESLLDNAEYLLDNNNLEKLNDFLTELNNLFSIERQIKQRIQCSKKTKDFYEEYEKNELNELELSELESIKLNESNELIEINKSNKLIEINKEITKKLFETCSKISAIKLNFSEMSIENLIENKNKIRLLNYNLLNLIKTNNNTNFKSERLKFIKIKKELTDELNKRIEKIEPSLCIEGYIY